MKLVSFMKKNMIVNIGMNYKQFLKITLLKKSCYIIFFVFFLVGLKECVTEGDVTHVGKLWILHKVRIMLDESTV